MRKYATDPPTVDRCHGEIDTAIGLAAGEDERLRPLIENRPKPMRSTGARPLLAAVFDALVRAGLTTLHVAMGRTVTKTIDTATRVRN